MNVGTIVRYVGPDTNLIGREGTVVEILTSRDRERDVGKVCVQFGSGRWVVKAASLEETEVLFPPGTDVVR